MRGKITIPASQTMTYQDYGFNIKSVGGTNLSEINIQIIGQNTGTVYVSKMRADVFGTMCQHGSIFGLQYGFFVPEPVNILLENTVANEKIIYFRPHSGHVAPVSVIRQFTSPGANSTTPIAGALHIEHISAELSVTSDIYNVTDVSEQIIFPKPVTGVLTTSASGSVFIREIVASSYYTEYLQRFAKHLQEYLQTDK